MIHAHRFPHLHPGGAQVHGPDCHAIDGRIQHGTGQANHAAASSSINEDFGGQFIPLSTLICGLSQGMLASLPHHFNQNFEFDWLTQESKKMGHGQIFVAGYFGGAG